MIPERISKWLASALAGLGSTILAVFLGQEVVDTVKAASCLEPNNQASVFSCRRDEPAWVFAGLALVCGLALAAGLGLVRRRSRLRWMQTVRSSTDRLPLLWRAATATQWLVVILTWILVGSLLSIAEGGSAIAAAPLWAWMGALFTIPFAVGAGLKWRSAALYQRTNKALGIDYFSLEPLPLGSLPTLTEPDVLDRLGAEAVLVAIEGTVIGPEAPAPLTETPAAAWIVDGRVDRQDVTWERSFSDPGNLSGTPKTVNTDVDYPRLAVIHEGLWDNGFTTQRETERWVEHIDNLDRSHTPIQLEVRGHVTVGFSDVDLRTRQTDTVKLRWWRHRDWRTVVLSRSQPGATQRAAYASVATVRAGERVIVSAYFFANGDHWFAGSGREAAIAGRQIRNSHPSQPAEIWSLR